MRLRWFAGMTLLAAVAGCAAPGASDRKQESAAAQPPAPAAEATGSAGHARIGAWGVDLAGADLTVKPGDDFYRYSGGHWLDTTQIPADRTSWTEFTVLADNAQRDLRTIVESLPADAPAGSTEQKVGDFYRAFLDTDSIERLGLAPAQPGLQAIAAARTHADIARLMGRRDLGVRGPVRLAITADQKNPDRYVATIAQAGLGLPDRDYYLKTEPVYVDLRARYAAHIARMLTLAGEPDAAKKAGYILDIETRIAQAQWPAARRRERNLTYNLRTHAELEQQNPGIPWQPLLASQGLDTQPEFVLRELDAIQALSRLFAQVPVDRWRAYCRYHYLVAVSDVLPHAFDAERFDFHGHTLNGQPQEQDRWKRGIDALDSDIGEAIGRLYVQRYFPPSAKQQVLDLVENMRAAYAVRIRNLTWMSAATKQVALEKLAAFHPKIGYPDQWRDYSALDIRPGDAFGNSVRAQVFEWQRQLGRLGKPTDRGEWGLTPQTINAYYNAQFNEVVFPAAILQPPFFDPNADAAVNYGAVGAVIGHEMGHGFDDQGSKSDAHGVLRTWWQPADEEAFRKRVDSLAAQYDGFTALPGLNVNGRLTLGENIGDLGGLSVAYEAYHISLHGKPAPLLDGLTGDQRFFLSWAQVWRALYRDEQLRTLTLSNPHSPSRFRVIGPIRNIDAWYSAFDVKPGDQLYLPPEDRVHIW
ncbi:MAG TPA: M13 family metallopeptidase [Steroidobacteraceae bacterium]|nr:M13 family metallopeptidase [Steroidobacteraceae bacterium]